MADVQDGRKLIAVVEDDPYLTDMLSDMLTCSGCWRLRFFADGQTAKDHLPKLGADLILLDVGLPHLDGVSLYKILCGHNSTKHIPIIVITASHEWELHRMGLKAGLVLRKPFNMQELIGMINALLPKEG